MRIIQLQQGQIKEFRELMALFAEAFKDKTTYLDQPPSDQYVLDLLNNPKIIHLVAIKNHRVVGGLVAYVLDKFEQERSEIYIYDLAVAKKYRRQKIATQLILKTKSIAKKLKSWVIIIQADEGDLPPIKLYQSLGREEKVRLYDIFINANNTEDKK